MPGTRHLVNIAHFSKLRTAVARSENGAYSIAVDRSRERRAPLAGFPSIHLVRFAGT